MQVLWIALPLAALLLPGCPIYTDDGHGAACTSDRDCASGQSCIGNTCHTVTPVCTNDRDCATGEHCEAMACIPGTRVCETHGDCDVSFMCDVSSCEPSITCTSDADCAGSPAGPTGWCDFRGTCVPRGNGECRTTADCTGTDLCIEGTCTPLPTTCQFAYDCPAGTACVNAECTPVCTSDAGCVAGDVCNSSHFCEPAIDCETSATCTNGEHCVGGRCLADCHGGASCPSAGTRATSYCASDSFCHPGWQPAIACTTDAMCASGRHCLSHVCRTPCPDGATSAAAGNAQCATIDSTLPYCLLDTASGEYLCNAQMSATASCRLSTDCDGGEDCVNAACQ